MRLAIYSDLHLECDRLVAPLVLPRVGCDVAIYAGDVHTKGRTPEAARRLLPDVPEILVVAGNHEFYSGHWTHSLEQLRRRAARARVRFLENDQVIIGDVRFLGCTLWVDYSVGPAPSSEAMVTAFRQLNDYRYIRAPRASAEMWEPGPWGGGRLTPGLVSQRHWASVAWLRARLAEPFAGKTCVITHHAPTMKSLPAHFANDLLTPAYVSNQEGLFEHVDLWVHGHLHNSSDYRVGRVRLVCNPRGYAVEGYPEELNSEFDPGGLVIEI